MEGKHTVLLVPKIVATDSLACYNVQLTSINPFRLGSLCPPQRESELTREASRALKEEVIDNDRLTVANLNKIHLLEQKVPASRLPRQIILAAYSTSLHVHA